MSHVRAEDAFALKTRALGDPLRGEIVGIGDQVEPFERQLLKRVIAEHSQSVGRDTSAARVSDTPIANVSRLGRFVDAHANRTNKAACLFDGELVRTQVQRAADERLRVLLGVWTRSNRYPVLDLRVLACLQHRERVVLVPRTEC
jgi:hypothetical protein